MELAAQSGFLPKLEKVGRQVPRLKGRQTQAREVGLAQNGFDQVAQAIAREIQAELSPEEETRFASLATVNPEAHEAYLRGRYEQAKGTPEGFQSAIRFYEEAVEIDSTYAPAYAGLAGSQLLLGMSDTTIVVAELPEVIETARRAVTSQVESSKC